MCGDEAQQRLLSHRGNGTDRVIVTLPSNHVAYVPDCRFDLGQERAMQNSRVGATGMGSNLGFWSKRRSRSHRVAKSSGRLNLHNDAQIRAD